MNGYRLATTQDDFWALGLPGENESKIETEFQPGLLQGAEGPKLTAAKAAYLGCV